ncbi:MAG: hypothetical protein WCO71_09830, partial [Pseudomonadota bacterium]
MKQSTARRNSDSRANIWIQISKSFGIFAALGGLFYYQYEFLHAAIFAQPVLNLGILSIFVFGSLLAVLSNVRLFDEDRALQAMKETWSDFDEMERSNDHAGVKRLMRTAEPARVFEMPRILGPVYEIMMAELLKTRALRLSLGQRNAMLAKIN